MGRGRCRVRQAFSTSGARMPREYCRRTTSGLASTATRLSFKHERTARTNHARCLPAHLLTSKHPRISDIWNMHVRAHTQVYRLTVKYLHASKPFPSCTIVHGLQQGQTWVGAKTRPTSLWKDCISRPKRARRAIAARSSGADLRLLTDGARFHGTSDVRVAPGRPPALFSGRRRSKVRSALRCLPQPQSSCCSRWLDGACAF